MTVASAEMPRYRSHKTVWALKIKSVTSLGEDSTADENSIVMIEFEDHRFAAKRCNLQGKPTPEAGWYYVVYENEYWSFSPAKAFEEGNTLETELHTGIGEFLQRTVEAEYNQAAPSRMQLNIFERAARAAHEANRIFCESQGDHSQPKWEDAPQWQKDSAIAGVKMIVANPSTTPEQSHEGWLKQKAEDGWKYGPVKDAENKKHPCFVPYGELPEAQRAKDHLFGLVVRTALEI